MVGAGKISPDLAKLVGHRGLLGPVKASSLRVASRIANQIKAGRAVASWTDLAQCDLILISMPDAEIRAVLASAADAPVKWRGKAFVLFGSSLDSADMHAISLCGAACATFEKMEGFASNRFALEGDPIAVREMRRFLKFAGATSRELVAGKKPLYSAGKAFAGMLFTPIVEATVDCFRKAGLAPQDAVAYAEACFLQTLRAYRKAGKQGWGGPLAEQDSEAVNRLLLALVADNPLLVNYFAHTSRLALDVFGHDKEWLEKLENA